MKLKNMKRPAVFLDRDGTLIEEVNYLSALEDLKIFPFAADSLELLKRHGYLIVVITNQSGIGRGIFPESEMHAIHDHIGTELAGLIDRFYFCPHEPDDGCNCRKPNTGMIRRACEDLGVALADSWMIGDKSLDVEAGKNAGLKTILVRTGYGDRFDPESTTQPDYIEDDLLRAAERIVSTSRRALDII